jgi:hypothetical protein
VVVCVDVIYVDVGSDLLQRGRPELFFHYLKKLCLDVDTRQIYFLSSVFP